MLTFYYCPPASSLASHIALEESGLDYEHKRVQLGDAADRAALLIVNPRGTVPALVVDGQTLVENVAILGYLASRATQTTLMPSDPLQRAQCISIMAWFASTVHIAFRQARRPEKFAADATAHESIKARGHESFQGALKSIDDLLSERAWMAGANYTVADGYALLFYGWGVLNEYSMDSFRHFAAFKDRMLERPAVRTVLQREQNVLLR